MQPRRDQPIRVVILNDYEIVVAGVATFLAPYDDRVKVVERVSQLLPVMEADVVLYDTFGQAQGDALDIGAIKRGSEAKVVVFSWNTDPGLISRAISRGASGYIAKAAGAEEVVDAIERVQRGEVVRPPQATTSDSEPEVRGGAWPGQREGLTARESEVVALITQGLSNQEIAEQCFLSINSVKTYIRTAYRKMGTSRRAQAVRWGIEHGFEPDTSRHIEA